MALSSWRSGLQSQTFVDLSRQRRAELAQDDPAEGAEQSEFFQKRDSKDQHWTADEMHQDLV